MMNKCASVPFGQSDVPRYLNQLSVASAIFSGVQLLTIGFIGEYLARLYFRSMDKPTYTIRSLAKKSNR